MPTVYHTPLTTAKSYTLPYTDVISELDPNTGLPLIKSGINVRTILPEQFKTATFIAKTNSANNGSSTIYTIPDGKVLLLTSICLQVSFQAASLGNGGQLTLDGNTLLRGYGSDVSGAYAMNQSLPTLIVCSSSSVFAVDNSSAKVRHTGSIFGYLIDASEYKPISSFTK